MSLKDILQRSSDRRNKAGGAVSAELIEDLRVHRKQQFMIFLAVEIVLIAAVTFCAYYLVRNPNAGTQVQLFAGLMGIGAGGGIEVMRRIWKDWSQAELLLILVAEASEAQVTNIVDKLIAKL